MTLLYEIDEHGIKNWNPLFPLVLSVIFLSAIIVASSIALYFAEQMPYADCLWLAFMGASTVGFGAVYPATEIGRVIVSLTASLGICTFGAIGTFSAMWAFGFFDTESKNRELKAQNAEIIRLSEIIVRTNQESVDGNNEIIRTNLISNEQNAEILKTLAR